MARIFISSTTEDLKEHREAVISALGRLGHEPIVLQGLVADGNKAPFDLSRELIDSCQLFIGILAWRYGFIPTRENPDGRSFVELEHRYAWDKGKPTLVFLTDDDAKWPQRFVDRGRQAELQEKFRSEVLSRVTVGYFTSADDLVHQVVEAASKSLDALSAPDLQPLGLARSGETPPPPSLPPGLDPLELAWRLVVNFKADPALLRHMELDQLRDAVVKWAGEDRSPRYEAALEQLRKEQPDLAPHALWLAWMRATRTSLQTQRERQQHA